MQTIALYTSTPRFAADWMDVVRVFLGDKACVLTKAQDADLVHTLKAQDGQWVCAFYYQAKEMTRSMPILKGNAIEAKRVLKRFCKQVLYDLFKALTGIHPPWGSLTGIRPTRLFYAHLEKGMDFQDAQRMLETRYDVTADKAALVSRVVAVQTTLPAPNAKEADVYIGIPFCPSLCAYCSFSSGEIGDGKLVKPYLAALFKDMAATALLIKELGLSYRAVYVGGGTPTALNESDFALLLDHLSTQFPFAREVTVEAGRPDSLTRKKLQTLYDHGIHRISINPQTMNDATLRLIGRGHTAQEVLDATHMARDVGLLNINMDLIAGLPGETLADFENTLTHIEALNPQSLTLHTLAIKRSSALHQKAHPLPDGDAVRQMLQMGQAAADRKGLLPYYLYRQKHMAGSLENVGYASEGCACLYNVDMMEETTHIFGIGAGAMSKRISDQDKRAILRAPSVSDIQSYIARTDDMIKRKRALWNRE